MHRTSPRQDSLSVTIVYPLKVVYLCLTRGWRRLPNLGPRSKKEKREVTASVSSLFTVIIFIFQVFGSLLNKPEMSIWMSILMSLKVISFLSIFLFDFHLKMNI